MSEKKLEPARGLVGTARLPGDKSISHRLGILGGLADGTTELVNFSAGEDCQRTLDCLQALGVSVEAVDDGGAGQKVRIEGRGLAGWEAPVAELYAGNSGTTMRLLAGALAAHSFESVLAGDASLSRRPMRRVMEPLDRKSTRLNSSHIQKSRMPSSA